MFCLQCGTEFPDSSNRCTACGWELGATTPLAAAVAEPGRERTEVARVLEGEYEIGEELGRGGMAIVYRGIERALEREVAIKVLPFTFAFDTDFVERFQREARTAARLEHPHIIPIYRVGRAGNVIYFTMKYLRGESLARVVAQRGALPTRQIRRLLREAGGALGYAHEHGVVHRDVKPDNIMFHESGHAVVCDFGIAKAASESRLTGTGTAIGTPHYMSPEQARAQPLDGRSDLYSLGVVAYKCLTGRVPFDAEDSYAIGIKHITEPLSRPQLESQDQEDLFAVIARLLEKSPEDRFPNAAAMIEAVETLDVTHGRGAGAVVVETRPLMGAVTEVAPAAATTPTPTTPMPRSSSAQTSRARRRRRIPALVGALVVAVGIGGGAFAWNVARDRGPAAAGAPGPADPVQIATVPPAEITEAPAVARGAPERGEPSPPTQSASPRPPDSGPSGGDPAAGVPTTTPRDTSVDTGHADSTRVAGVPVTPPKVGDSAAAPPAPRSPTEAIKRRLPRAAAVVSAVVDSVRARATEAGMGRLEIRGVMTGARIFIGDREVHGRSHNLPAGTHHVRVTRSGYEDFLADVVIEAGKVARLRVRQQRPGSDRD